MNKLDSNRRAHVVKCLVEGNGLRATARITGVARMTVEKLFRDLGAACVEFHNRTVRNLTSERIECDEIWAFCYAKRKTVEKHPSILDKHADAGDVWTWTALDPDSKLMVSWLVGERDSRSAYAIMCDIRDRMTQRIQLTTDQLSIYLKAVDRAFGISVDFAMLNKIYAGGGDGRYSPAVCIGCKKVYVTGYPDPDRVSTSHVERTNLGMRTNIRRFTRLTNAHSKKLEMHRHSVAIHFTYYNFVRLHETLRMTPAMAAGLTTRAWEVADLLALLPDSTAKASGQ